MRCICKTDIQNLVARNVSREDIAASIFHAVAVQTVVTLAHGWDIKAPVLFCGGPLTFIPALRKAFIEYLHLQAEDIVLPENGTLLPALGAALSSTQKASTYKLSQLTDQLRIPGYSNRSSQGLPPIFSTADEHKNGKTESPHIN